MDLLTIAKDIADASRRVGPNKTFRSRHVTTSTGQTLVLTHRMRGAAGSLGSRAKGNLRPRGIRIR